jgi:protocatechuate 3,4-dioxygenase alpha subunit
MKLTPSQTIGPFFGHALPWKEGPYAAAPGTEGAVWIRGRVLDGAGEPVPDALVESWQAGPSGIRGFGRSPTDEQGGYAILTVKPGPVPGPDGTAQAPHLDLSVFARGLLDRVVTRVYFADEGPANDADPVLSGIDEPERGTLIARAAEDGYAFDIRLQGEHETVFFDV